MGIIVSVLGALFVFSLIVFAHEFGHFIAARKNGVRVQEFAFGFPPKIWSRVKGNTKYVINIIPLGGYVKLHGEDGSDEQGPDSFASKSALRKIVILLAGVFLNFVLAYFILFGNYVVGFQPILPDMAKHKGVQNDMRVLVNEVEKDTPAEKQGLQKGDVIKEVDGRKVNDSTDMVAYIQERVDKDKNAVFKIQIDRNGEILTKTFSTYTSKQKVGKKEVEVNRIGVILETQGKIHASLPSAFIVSFQELGRIMFLTVQGVVDLFARLILSFQVSENVAGPVGLFVITGNFAQMGLPTLIQFAAILSVAVGVFNIIPIPGLDGGHTLIILIESVIRKKFSNKSKNVIQFVGFGALILLMIVVTFKDVFTFGIMK